MPARKGNTTGLTHGVNSFLATGALPAGCSHIKKEVGKLKAALEAEVLLVHGKINIIHKAAIQTALRHEVVALLLQRWLRISIDTLTPSERVAHATGFAKASAARDAALKELGLHVDKRKDAIDALFTEPEAAAE